jgi:hypothetical protein
MLPDNVTSSIGFGGLFVSPDDRVTTPIVDYERGGIALLDTSQGLQVKNWRVYLEDVNVYVLGEGDPSPTLLFSESQITEISLAFDQNMRWSVGYIANGVLKLRWYDSTVSARVTTTFEAAVNPKMALDDKRALSVDTSDMILAYLRGSTLYYRQQRDRFLIERALRTDLFPGTKLKNIGMNKNLRMQFELV